jgi:hypothetical protein
MALTGVKNETNMPRPTRKSQGLDPLVTTSVKATRKELDAAIANYGSLAACIRYCAKNKPEELKLNDK